MASFPADSVRTKNWITETLTDADLEGQFDLLHEYLKAALNSSTGHNHDGTSNQSKKLDKASLVDDFVDDYTTVTGLSTDYLLLADVSDSNKTKKALASDFTYSPTAANALAGSQVQFVKTTDSTVRTLTVSTAFPEDNTIPQNTEGVEYTQLATSITPNSATNRLLIEVEINFVGPSTSNGASFGAAIFQDSTANALRAGLFTYNSTTGNRMVVGIMRHEMAAGTTSATTFKVRVANGSETTTCYANGNPSGSALYGGVMTSSMRIYEIKV